MHCPTCIATDLVMADRQGIEIDYCPQCRGVWLDRGELDKIIDRSSAAVAPSAPAPQAPRNAPPSRPEYRDEREHKRYDDDDDDYYKKKKKKNFLGDIFDF